MALTVNRLEQRCAQSRGQGHGHQHRQHHGRHNSHGKLPVDNPRGTTEKRHGNKHRAQHQGDADQRAGDLVHRLARGFKGRQALFAHHPLDVFHHHNGVIHQQADGQDHRKHGQGIDRIAKHRQHPEGTQQHHRHSDRGDQRGAEILQEQEHDQHHQHDGLAQGLDHLFDGQADKGRGVVGNHVLELHFARVVRLQFGKLGLDRFTDLQRIGARGQLHAHGRSGFAVKGRIDVITVTAQLHRGHITEQHHGTGAGGLDHHIAKLFGGLQFAARTDGGIELLAGHGRQSTQLPGRHLGVLRLQGGGHVRRHKGVFLQQRRVQPDAHGITRAERLDLAHAIDTADGVEQGAGNIIADLGAGNARVIRRQGRNHQEVRAALGHGQAFTLHRCRQA